MSQPNRKSAIEAVMAEDDSGKVKATLETASPGSVLLLRKKGLPQVQSVHAAGSVCEAFSLVYVSLVYV